MKRVLLRRPTLQMLMLTGGFLADAICSFLAAQALSFWFLWVVGVICALMAMIVALAWKNFRYEICVSRGHQNYVYSPILIWRIGILNYTEYHYQLDDLRQIIAQRPILWRWCDAADITLYFRNGKVFHLGIVSPATKGIELLYTAMPLRTYTWNIPVDQYDTMAA